MSEPSTNPVRQALRAMTHGVYVLSVADTLGDDTRDDYLVVSLAMQCSVEPARIAFALSVNARILRVLRHAGSGVLSILEASASAAVRRYGAPGGVRHGPADAVRTQAGHPVPPEASYWLPFQVAQEIAVGDHVMFVADVTDAGRRDAVSTAPDHANSGAFNPMTLTASGFPYAG